ncbi:MAG: hypothetical protein ACPGO5_03245 [Patescibacteria group bacterium]
MSEATQAQNNQFKKPAKANQKQSGGAARWIVTVIIVVIIILGGLFLVSKYTNLNVLGLSQNSGQWQAVFLTNGQVYFGQIDKMTNDEIVLTDIYYLQITQPLQRSADGSNQQQQQNELALVKLGNELHGPTDEMHINRRHVLFTEDLKEDSKVVQAIEQSREVQ